MRSFFAPIVLLATPLLASAAPRSYADLVGFVINMINNAVAVLVLAALVIYLFLLAFSLMGGGENSKQRSKAMILWGIIILFVMVSIWGIVYLVHDTFFKNQQATSSLSQP